MAPAEEALWLLRRLLLRLVQEREGCGEPMMLVQELMKLEDVAMLARDDADPMPLPADRQRLLKLLEALHQELRLRVD